MILVGIGIAFGALGLYKILNRNTEEKRTSLPFRKALTTGNSCSMEKSLNSLDQVNL
jgi:hypothetical protein